MSDSRLMALIAVACAVLISLGTALVLTSQKYLTKQLTKQRGTFDIYKANNLAMLKMLADSAPSPFYFIDANHRCMYVSTKLCELVGHTRHKCLRSNMHDLIHYQRADGTPYPIEACEKMDALKHGSTVHNNEDTIWHKDGTPIPCRRESAPIKDSSGKICGARITIEPWTQAGLIKYKAEKTCSLPSQFVDLVEAIRNIEEPYVLADGNWKVIRATKLACKISGKEEHNLIGTDATDASEYRLVKAWKSGEKIMRLLKLETESPRGC